MYRSSNDGGGGGPGGLQRRGSGSGGGAMAMGTGGVGVQHQNRVRQVGRYRLSQHLLGKGNFARVELATHCLLGLKVAVKMIDKSHITEDYVRRNLGREARIMARLRHPHIAALYEAIESGQLVCLVTELAPGGDLCSFVKGQPGGRLSELTARPFVRQIVSALAYMHARGIIHRDLKMENVMLDETQTQAKIVDFGLSNFYGPGASLQTHCGSPEYAAPELFVPGRPYGPEVDVWSLGVITYGALAGSLPFLSGRNDGTSAQERRHRLYRRIQQGLRQHHWQALSSISPDCRDLLLTLLNPNPTKRASLDRIQKHDWVTLHGRFPLVQEVEPTLHDQDGRAVLQRLSEVLSLPATVLEGEIERDDHCEVAAMFYLMLSAQRQNARRGQAIRQHLSLCHLMPTTTTDADNNGGTDEECATNGDTSAEDEQAPPYTMWSEQEMEEGFTISETAASRIEAACALPNEGDTTVEQLDLRRRSPSLADEASGDELTIRAVTVSITSLQDGDDGSKEKLPAENGDSKTGYTETKLEKLKLPSVAGKNDNVWSPRLVPPFLVNMPLGMTDNAVDDTLLAMRPLDTRVMVRECAGYSLDHGVRSLQPTKCRSVPCSEPTSQATSSPSPSVGGLYLHHLCWKSQPDADTSNQMLVEKASRKEERRRCRRAKKRKNCGGGDTCLCMVSYASQVFARLDSLWMSFGCGKLAWCSTFGLGRLSLMDKSGSIQGVMLNCQDLLNALSKTASKRNGHSHNGKLASAVDLLAFDNVQPMSCCILWVDKRKCATCIVVDSQQNSVIRLIDAEAAKKLLAALLSIVADKSNEAVAANQCSVVTVADTDKLKNGGATVTEGNEEGGGENSEEQRHSPTFSSFRFSSPDKIKPFVSQVNYTPDNTYNKPSTSGEEPGVPTQTATGPVPHTVYEGSWRYRDPLYLHNGVLWPPPLPLMSHQFESHRSSDEGQSSRWTRTSDEEWRNGKQGFNRTTRSRRARNSHETRPGSNVGHNTPWSRGESAFHSVRTAAEMGHLPPHPYQLPAPTFLGYDISGQPMYGYMPLDGWRHNQDSVSSEWQEIRCPWVTPEFGWMPRITVPYLGPPFPPPQSSTAPNNGGGQPRRDGRKGSSGQ